MNFLVENNINSSYSAIHVISELNQDGRQNMGINSSLPLEEKK